jgi:hypothetical protein
VDSPVQCQHNIQWSHLRHWRRAREEINTSFLLQPTSWTGQKYM